MGSKNQTSGEQAAAIMKQKAFIKAELDRQLSQAESDRIWMKATKKLESYLTRYADLPKGVHSHTDSMIFPSAAIYLTAKETLSAEQAYSVIENAAAAKTNDIGKKLAKIMKIPGFAGFFIKMWDPVSKKQFGAACGFKNVFYPKKKGEYRMDILACPYQTYFSELGCPELTKIFCDNDLRTYGNLPGLQFIRTSTLGTGGERCDFYIKKV